MTKISSTILACALAVGACAGAQAQGRWDRDGDRHDNGWHGNKPDKGWKGNGHDNGWHGNNPGRGGYIRHNDWRRGYRLRPDDWNRGQRIDYRQYRLAPPRRGYEWRQIDGNFVMAAVATGIIASLVAANAGY